MTKIDDVEIPEVAFEALAVEAPRAVGRVVDLAWARFAPDSIQEAVDMAGEFALLEKETVAKVGDAGSKKQAASLYLKACAFGVMRIACTKTGDLLDAGIPLEQARQIAVAVAKRMNERAALSAMEDFQADKRRTAH